MVISFVQKATQPLGSSKEVLCSGQVRTFISEHPFLIGTCFWNNYAHPPKDEKVRVGFLCNLYTLSRPLILAPESKTWCRSLQISRQSLLCGLGHPLALILDTSQWQTKLSVGRELGNAISSEPAGCQVSLYHYFLRSQKFQTGAWASR